MKHPSTNFSLIIPNFNGSKFISPCLESIFSAINQSPQSKFEIIIIDNGSTDNSCQLSQNLLNQHPRNNLSSKIYHLRSNHGFAFAVNYGINRSRYDYVVLINNDLTIKPDWFKIITPIISANKNPKITTFFGTVLNHNGQKFESQGFRFFPSGKCLHIANGNLFHQSKITNLKPKLVWGAPGVLVVYHRKTLLKIGAFDPDFFAYLEDVDVSVRLNKFGYQTLYIPRAISYHLGGGTSNSMNNFRYRMDVRNWFYLIIKNYSVKDLWINFFPILTERLRNLSGLIKNTIKIFGLKSIWVLPQDILKTYGQVVLNFPKMLKKRRQLQKKLINSLK